MLHIRHSGGCKRAVRAAGDTYFIKIAHGCPRNRAGPARLRKGNM